MPVYDQLCSECGTEFEIITGSYTAPRPCPNCSSLRTEQQISLPHFRIAARRSEIKRGPAHNPYENLTLAHIRDERGKPVKVNSEAELHAAEKRHNFIHAASWGMADKPPQHDADAGNIARNYKKKFNRDPAAYTRPDAKNGVSAGVAANASETLAYHPNPV
jgi:putative FmdB family regulatory protein